MQSYLCAGSFLTTSNSIVTFVNVKQNDYMNTETSDTALPVIRQTDGRMRNEYSFNRLRHQLGRRDSSVGIALSYGLDDRWFESR
jgi:hypothetical protein